jgi:hypothetical protein
MTTWCALPGRLLTILVWCATMPAVCFSADAGAANLALENLRAANVARAELAAAENEWRIERERLQAVIAATRAEAARLERDSAAAEARRTTATSELVTLTAADELEAARKRLGDTGARVRNALAALARTMPPGTIAVPSDDSSGEAAFDAAIRALDAAERAATSVAVEVVSGTRAGQPEAVKLLRIAGAVAWWVSLDGTAAGTARQINGALHLDNAQDEPTRLAITRALAQAEGRAQPTIVLLPAPNPTTTPAPTPAAPTQGTP